MPGDNGERCPYQESAPVTDDGVSFWQLTMACSGQLRTAGMGGIIGFDIHAFFAGAEAYGLERDVVLALLPYAEAGMREGIATLREQEEEQQVRARKKKDDG